MQPSSVAKLDRKPQIFFAFTDEECVGAGAPVGCRRRTPERVSAWTSVLLSQPCLFTSGIG